jgi:hypothetical protein
MSFWPFPKIILDELRAGLRRGIGIEVGSGDGRLSRRLGDCGIFLHALDLQAPAEVRADARALPIATAGVGLIVVGNLLRHLSEGERVGFLFEADAALAAGGRLLLLEDDPEARNAAERNYRRALGYLRDADDTRGAALDLDQLLAARPDSLSTLVVDLRVENEELIEDDVAPLRWLAARGFARRDGFREFEESVERDGMSYGRYRACVLRRAEATGGRSQ